MHRTSGNWALVILFACLSFMQPTLSLHIGQGKNMAGKWRGSKTASTGNKPVGSINSAEVNSNGQQAVSGMAGHAVEGLKNMVASGVASAVGKALLQPFDSIKTIQQNSKEGPLSIVAAASILLSRGGPFALYAGLGATILGSVPSIAVYFGVYQFLKGQLSVLIGTSFGIALSAALANLLAAFVRVPFEIVKQRLQAGIYADTASAVAGMYADAGLAAFFPLDGMMGQVLRDIPYAVVTLLAYESLKKSLGGAKPDNLDETNDKKSKVKVKDSKPSNHSQTQGRATAVWVSLITGAAAGGLGTFVTNPMDVIKTRLMVSPHLYRGYWGAIATILEQEGVGAFMKGALPRLIHKMPANSIFFMVYEAMRRVLGVKR